MPLEPPSRSDDYLITPLHKLSADLLGGVTHDIAIRLNAIEASLDGIDGAAQQQVAAAIDAATDQLATLVEDQRAEFEAISAQVAATADQLQEIQASGVAGSRVSLTDIEGLAATDAQAAIAELLAFIAAEVEARSEAISNEATARTAAIAAVKPVTFVPLTVASTLEAGKAYRFKAAGVTHTLPQGALADDASIAFVDGEVIGEEAIVSLDGGDKTIMGSSDPFEVDVSGARFILWLSGTDWRVHV